jgi:hypothetical protein
VGRDQWHAFWNAECPCRILAIISPAGFEHLFDDSARRGPREDDGARYGLEVDLAVTHA